MPPQEVYLTANLDGGIVLSIFRFSSPRVMFQLSLDKTSGRKFDKYRLGFISLDEKIEVDFCQTKLTHEILSNLETDNGPTFVFEDTEVSGLVWHGLVNEGTGVVGKMIKASKISARVYYDDYTSSDYLMSDTEFSNLKNDVKSKIFGL